MNEERKSEELQNLLGRGQQTIPSSVNKEGRSANENVQNYHTRVQYYRDDRQRSQNTVVESSTRTPIEEQ